jgi:hypothetical protein
MTFIGRPSIRTVAFGLLLAAIAPAPARAQASVTRAQDPPVGKWELEGYGGLSLGRFTSGGTATLPPAGAPIVTSSPVFPSWSVPSWFFGDGAAFLNNVMAEFGLAGRVTPLDEWLRPVPVRDFGSLMAGLRLRRGLSPPWSIEIGLEMSAQSVDIPDDMAAGLDATASTFRATFSELLSTGPFVSPVVTSSVIGASDTRMDMTVTAALNYAIDPIGTWEPYAVAGGGVVLPTGSAVTAGLSGHYGFQIAGSVAIDETDSLTIRQRGRVTLVAVGGGGLRRAVTDRWGVRIDARVLLGPATTVVAVEAVPAVVTGTPAGFIESFTYPNLQFSNNASTGRRSTLGPPSLDDVVVFEGGWQLRGRATFGLYFLF